MWNFQKCNSIVRRLKTNGSGGFKLPQMTPQSAIKCEVKEVKPNVNGSASLSAGQPIPTSTGSRRQRNTSQNTVNASVVRNTGRKHGLRDRPKKQSSASGGFHSDTSEHEQSTVAKRKRTSTTLSRIQGPRIISPSIFTGVNLREDTLTNGGGPQDPAATRNNRNRSTEEITDSQLNDLFTPNMIFTQHAAVQTESVGNKMLKVNAYTQTNIPVRNIGVNAEAACAERSSYVRHIATNTDRNNAELVPIGEHYLLDRDFTQQFAYRIGVDEAFLRHTIYDLLSEDVQREVSMPSHRQQDGIGPRPFYVNDGFAAPQNHDRYGWLAHENDFEQRVPIPTTHHQQGRIAPPPLHMNHNNVLPQHHQHQNGWHEDTENDINYGNEVDHLTNLTMRLNTSSPTHDFGRHHLHDEFRRYGCNLSPIRHEDPPIHATDPINNNDIGVFEVTDGGLQDVLNEGFTIDESDIIDNLWNSSNDSTGPKVIDATIA